MSASSASPGTFRPKKRPRIPLRASLAEKEILLKEIHHRVKNNMQIIHSLLNLQAAQVEDAAFLGMIRDSQRRVRSMSLVHEQLYRSPDLSRIDFRDYLQALIAGLVKSMLAEPRVRVVTEIGDVRLDIHTAIPCGLLVSELVSNAFKHAFPAAGRARSRSAWRAFRTGS